MIYTLYVDSCMYTNECITAAVLYPRWQDHPRKDRCTMYILVAATAVLPYIRCLVSPDVANAGSRLDASLVCEAVRCKYTVAGVAGVAAAVYRVPALGVVCG